MLSQKKRIWGWMFFDWAQQPYATLGLTFIFGPFFASVAATYFISQGLDATAAGAQSQSLWSLGQTISGLFIAFTAPLLGAWADASGRKLPWIFWFSVIVVICAASLWFLTPDGALLIPVLILFWFGFFASESALNINNAMLPSLGDEKTVGRISGSGGAFGYWGGVLSLFIMLLLLAENDAGKTLIGIPPLFGLDPETREGTRSVGPFIAIWYAVFMIPFFLWSREDKPPRTIRPTISKVFSELVVTLRGVFKRRSLGNFLLGSMLYRDALNAIYSFGGIYAALVLGWHTIQIGVFGIIAAIAAAILTWVGGLADQKYGPKPVIMFTCWVLVGVSIVVVGMSRESLFGIPLPEGSMIPDIIFYICGGLLGGAGGANYSASRTMMIRHTHPDRPAESFGLFALTGKATAFLAPALVGLFTWWTGSVQLGFLPVIGLFLIGLFLLRYVDKDGDRAEWSAYLPQSR
ncbi:MAG: MFS transporter [Rhodobacterales bacterium]|nr:MFS transporter [Rhodobacterales bacterium]